MDIGSHTAAFSVRDEAGAQGWEWCALEPTSPTEQAHGPNDRATAAALNNLAVVYWNQGRYEEALKAYGRALAIREKALGPEHPEVAQTLNNLAIVY